MSDPTSEREAAHSDALSLLRSTPNLNQILSDPSKLVMDSIQAAAGTLEAAGIDLGKQALSSVMPTLMQTFSDVAGSIPMLGAVISVVSTIVKGLFDMAAFNAASDQAYCSGWLQKFVAEGSGPMGVVVPADIFYPKINVKQRWPNVLTPVTAGPVVGVEVYPTALGMALALLTEGAPVDASDVNWKALKNEQWGDGPPTTWSMTQSDWGGDRLRNSTAMTYANAKLVPGGPYDAESFDRLREANAERINGEWMHFHPTTKPVPGVPYERRKLFRALRRAIRSSYVKPGEKNAISDGGVALWSIYLDLLLDERRKGHLPDQFISSTIVNAMFVYRTSVGVDLWGGDETIAVVGNPQTCASIATHWITDLISGWEKTVDPRYLQGKEKMGELRAQATSIGQTAAQNTLNARPGSKAKALASARASGVNPFWILGGTIAAGGLAAFFISQLHKDDQLKMLPKGGTFTSAPLDPFSRVLSEGVHDDDIVQTEARKSSWYDRPADPRLENMTNVFEEARARGVSATDLATSGRYFGSRALPIRIEVYASGRMKLTDGQHIYKAARGAGAKCILAHVVQYDGGHPVASHTAPVNLL